MINDQSIKNSLSQNKQISEEIKVSMKELITIFQNKFPDVSLDNLCERLKTLEILRGSKYLYDEAIQYNSLENKMVINQELLTQKDTDAKYSMMKALLSVITAKDNYYGFGNDRNLDALNVGFREIIANNLVGNDGISDYEDEQIIVNIIGNSIGVDTFFEAFFNNNAKLLMHELLKKNGDVSQTNIFLNQINHNMHTRKQIGVSNLYHIQKKLFSLYVSSYDFVMNPIVMESASKLKYPGKEELEQFIQAQATATMKR